MRSPVHDRGSAVGVAYSGRVPANLSRCSTSDGVSLKSKMAVLGDPLRVLRLRDRDDPVLDVPAEDDLRRGDAVIFCDPHDMGVTQIHRPERAVPLELHTAAAVRLEYLPVEERRVPLDLVDGRQATCRPLELVELSNAVVAHPYLAREPFRL